MIKSKKILDSITFKFVAEIDGDSICIGTEEEMSKLPPEQKYIIWKKLSKKEIILLLMGLQECDIDDLDDVD